MTAVDIQVNGYAGVDFNGDDLRAEDVARACARLESEGVGGILATVITAPLEAMCSRIAAVARVREQDPLVARLIAGVHVEGPFLNETPGYAGAHPPDAIVPADPEAARRLVDAGGGCVRLMTLAPERDPDLRVTRWLVEQGIRVAAGHCDPSPGELDAAIGVGLSLFTHLGNGCPVQLHRHDNIIHRVLACSDDLWISFIPDGIHLPFPVLGNLLRAAGVGRCLVVSDAISAAGMGPGTYTLGGRSLVIGEDRIARASADGLFSGSTVTWPEIRSHLRDELGLPPEDCERLTAIHPRLAIGLTLPDGSSALSQCPFGTPNRGDEN